MQEPKVADGDLWWVGVIIYMLCASMMAAGVVLTKLSLNRERERPKEHRRPRWYQKLWLVGIVFWVMSSVGMGLSLYFAAQSLLSPMRTIMIVTNAALAKLVLNEIFGLREGFATALIISGVAITTVFGDHAVEQYDADEMLNLYKKAGFIGFMCTMTVLITVLIAINYVLERRKREHPDGTTPRALPFTFGALGGSFGGCAAVLTKSALTVIISECNDGFGHMLSQPIVYGLLIALGVLYVGQIAWINKGLDDYDAVFLVPIEASFDSMVGTVGGLLYFEEYKKLDTGELFGFSSGLVVALLGVLIMALKPTSGEDAFGEGLPCASLRQVRESSSAEQREALLGKKM